MVRKEDRKKYKLSWLLNRQIPHIRRVQDYMILLELNRDDLPFYIPEWNLLQRSMLHDTDKFSNKLAENFLLLEEYWTKKRNNEITNLDFEELDKVCNLHYADNRHHLEFHKLNGIKIDAVDLCEMESDGLAAAERGGKNASDCLQYYRDNRNNGFELLVKHFFI